MSFIECLKPLIQVYKVKQSFLANQKWLEDYGTASSSGIDTLTFQRVYTDRKDYPIEILSAKKPQAPHLPV